MKKRTKHRHFVASVDEDKDQKTAIVIEVLKNGKKIVRQLKHVKKSRSDKE